jgi:hypothetical protein
MKEWIAKHSYWVMVILICVIWSIIVLRVDSSSYKRGVRDTEAIYRTRTAADTVVSWYPEEAWIVNGWTDKPQMIQIESVVRTRAVDTNQNRTVYWDEAYEIINIRSLYPTKEAACRAIQQGIEAEIRAKQKQLDEFKCDTTGRQ